MSFSCRFSRGIIVAFALFSATLAPLSGRGQAFYYNFGDVFTGDGPVSSDRPWVTALFQTISPGTVELTLSARSLTASENVDQFYFNLDPSFDPTSLNFAFVGTTGAVDLPAVSIGVNQFKADGDGKYDILFDFINGGTDANRFTQGDSVVMDITGIGSLTADDFKFMSAPAGGNGPFFAAIHVQRIGQSASKSGWVDPIDNLVTPVPEPTGTGLWMLAGGLLLIFRLIATRRSPALAPVRARRRISARPTDRH